MNNVVRKKNHNISKRKKPNNACHIHNGENKSKNKAKHKIKEANAHSQLKRNLSKANH